MKEYINYVIENRDENGKENDEYGDMNVDDWEDLNLREQETKDIELYKQLQYKHKYLKIRITEE